MTFVSVKAILHAIDMQELFQTFLQTSSETSSPFSFLVIMDIIKGLVALCWHSLLLMVSGWSGQLNLPRVRGPTVPSCSFSLFPWSRPVHVNFSDLRNFLQVKIQTHFSVLIRSALTMLWVKPQMRSPRETVMAKVLVYFSIKVHAYF